MRKSAVLVTALSIVGLGLLNAPASLADASVPAPYKLVSQCSGNLVPGFPKALTNRLGETQGSLRLYYSSANGGTNCVMLYDMASGRHPMTVTLRREDLSYPGSDSGTFEYYAGGVQVPGTNGKCVYVSGYLSMGPYSVDRFSGSWGPVACG